MDVIQHDPQSDHIHLGCVALHPAHMLPDMGTPGCVCHIRQTTGARPKSLQDVPNLGRPTLCLSYFLPCSHIFHHSSAVTLDPSSSPTHNSTTIGPNPQHLRPCCHQTRSPPLDSALVRATPPNIHLMLCVFDDMFQQFFVVLLICRQNNGFVIG